ncbi:hypothetical protein [Salipiger bermudensis]|uniref:hypothetical protein n=1 Tax=Salipiger bermudensis TaxID=344736 RepID=UPI001CD3ADB4|nr:hypothetical protein [Salipiger bermudensis]MCA1288436.1 hypothetical protein [Salipiger bermudensis]
MIETPDMRAARDTDTKTATSVETDWAPPSAPLEMPRQMLEAEARASESSLLRLFRKRSRA